MFFTNYFLQFDTFLPMTIMYIKFFFLYFFTNEEIKEKVEDLFRRLLYHKILTA